MIQARYPALLKTGTNGRWESFISLLNSMRRTYEVERPTTGHTVVTTVERVSSPAAPHINGRTSESSASAAQQQRGQPFHEQKRSDKTSTDTRVVQFADVKEYRRNSSLRLVFGTEGRQKRSISMDQVRLNHQMRDQDAISHLVEAYQRLRGFYKY